MHFVIWLFILFLISAKISLLPKYFNIIEKYKIICLFIHYFKECVSIFIYI